jgi:single-strand DNA-binding protein
MSGSFNSATIIGNVGQDPEIKSMQSGDKVANLSIATSESWKDKSGEKQERTQWHKVVVWNQNLVGIIEKYVKKGDKLFVQGMLETRKYEKDGVTHYTTEIVLKAFGGQIVLLGSKSGSGAQVDAVAAPAVVEEEVQIPF